MDAYENYYILFYVYALKNNPAFHFYFHFNLYHLPAAKCLFCKVEDQR